MFEKIKNSCSEKHPLLCQIVYSAVCPQPHKKPVWRETSTNDLLLLQFETNIITEAMSTDEVSASQWLRVFLKFQHLEIDRLRPSNSSAFDLPLLMYILCFPYDLLIAC